MELKLHFWYCGQVPNLSEPQSPFVMGDNNTYLTELFSVCQLALQMLTHCKQVIITNKQPLSPQTVFYLTQNELGMKHKSDVASSPHSVLATHCLPLVFLKRLIYMHLSQFNNWDMLYRGPSIARKPTAIN